MAGVAGYCGGGWLVPLLSHLFDVLVDLSHCYGALGTSCLLANKGKVRDCFVVDAG